MQSLSEPFDEIGSPPDELRGASPAGEASPRVAPLPHQDVAMGQSGVNPAGDEATASALPMVAPSLLSAHAIRSRSSAWPLPGRAPARHLGIGLGHGRRSRRGGAGLPAEVGSVSPHL
jgi:hypothetical protein